MNETFVTPVQPPAPPRRRGSAFAVIAVALLVVLLGVSVLVHIVLVLKEASGLSVAGGPATVPTPYKERLVEGDNDAPNKLLLVKLEGIITGEAPSNPFGAPTGEDPVTLLRHTLRQGLEDEATRGFLLEVDSPGGGVTASDVIHREIREAAAKKPVYAVMGDICASGGVYASSAATRVWAHPTTITGSIGVIISALNFHALLENWGIEDNTIKAGEVKDLLSPTRAPTEKERAILQELVDRMHKRFVHVVAEGRHLEEEKVWAFADGRVFDAATALELGLVDAVGYREDALAALRERLALPGARLVEYYRPPQVSVHFTVESNLDGGLPAALGRAVPGAGVTSLPGLLPAPRLLYLWAPWAH